MVGIKTHVGFHDLHESQIRYAHSGRSNICILRSQNRSTLISIYDKDAIASSFMIKMLLPLQDWIATVHKADARIEISE